MSLILTHFFLERKINNMPVSTKYKPTRLKKRIALSEAMLSLSGIIKTIKTVGGNITDAFIHSGDAESISKKAKPALFQFPIIVSNSVGRDELVTISKALEKQYVTFVCLAAGINNTTEVKNKEEMKLALKRLHNNIDNSMLNSVVEDCEDILEMNKRGLVLHEDIINFKSLCEADDTVNRKAVTCLIDNDVKKANEAIPTTVQLNFFVENSAGTTDQYSLIIGIKTISHLVPTNEMVENIVSSVSGGRMLFNFIKWTSGEISFIRDYILNFNKNKKDAINTASNKTSVWWSVLKSRAARSGMIRFVPGAKEQFPPNVTLLLSMEELENIKATHDIDLFGKDKSSLVTIMKDLFLLTVAVVDSGSEIVYLFYDGETDWQRYTLSQLDKENTKSDKDTKSLISLISGKR